MNELKIFENKDFGKVRVININDEVWFVGKDVAKSLGYSNTAKAIRTHIDSEDKTVNEKVTVNGTQAILINESGLYSLILSSRLPKAKKFRHWVTSEVLPSIVNTGSYGSQNIDPKIIAEIASIAAAQTVSMMMKDFTKSTSTKTENQEGRLSLKDNLIFSNNNQKLKVESFPEDFKDELDEIFLQMKENENVNFSAISRYCYKKGYPISNVSLSRYFKKNFY